MAIDPSRAFKPISIALLTVSDTRGPTTTLGRHPRRTHRAAGHRLAARAIEKDDADAIVRRLNNWIDDPAIDAVVSTGGTGLTGRDVTPEALERVKDKDDRGLRRVVPVDQLPARSAPAPCNRAPARSCPGHVHLRPARLERGGAGTAGTGSSPSNSTAAIGRATSSS